MYTVTDTEGNEHAVLDIVPIPSLPEHCRLCLDDGRELIMQEHTIDECLRGNVEVQA